MPSVNSMCQFFWQESTIGSVDPARSPLPPLAKYSPTRTIASRFGVSRFSVIEMPKSFCTQALRCAASNTAMFWNVVVGVLDSVWKPTR